MFLPAGLSGPVLVRVRATNIAGDGVPNNSDPTDQDFALVIYNAVQKMGRLQGTVTDQGTGVGLSGATVLAASSNWQYRTSTDASGVYTLTIPANLYAVSAWKFGYSQENVSNVMVVQDQINPSGFKPVGLSFVQFEWMYPRPGHRSGTGSLSFSFWAIW